MNGKIAIIGGNNFIGFSLAKRLYEDGYSFIVIDIERPPALPKDVPYYKVDLTQTTADAILANIFKREEIKTIFHLAFLESPTHNLSLQHELEVIGTLYITHACAEAGVEKIIMKSTTMVYGAHPSNPNFLTEDHPVKGNTRYPFVRDKVEAESIMLNFKKKHPEVAVTILRLATIIGPEIDYYITRILSRSVIPILMGYDPLYQLLHEDDAVEAFLAALRSDAEGIFNIADEGVLPITSILKLLGRIPLPLLHTVAYPLVDSMWLAGVSPVPAAHLDYIRYLWVADTQKVKEEMGFWGEHDIKSALESFFSGWRLRKMRLITQ